jgi:hypothetical protein
MVAEAPLLSEIEGLLVREFQLCQDLLALTREERRALLTGDIHNLALLVERKEVLLDEFSQLDEMRRMRITLLAEKLAAPVHGDCCLADLAARLLPKNARRLLHLHQGISALKVEIKDLTPGNQNLALAAAGRAFTLQRSLLEISSLSPPVRRASTV